MDRELAGALEARFGAAVAGARPVGGGSIHQALLVELADGRRRFVKTHPEPRAAAMFAAEAAGLAALAGPATAAGIRIPGEAETGETASGRAFLAMEAIEPAPGAPGGDFFADFGRRFARFHRASARGDDRHGFDHDNFIGSTPQPNPWTEGWPGFFRRHRLGFQLDLARRTGRSDPELDRLGASLLDRLDDLLDAPGEPPCLLHGDLWSGNYLVDATHRPVLVDPAVYHGHREADLAMTSLFGGFPGAFYRGYEDEWPLPPGTEERQAIYQLYHLLNHLNLFGGGYRAQCLAVLRRFG